MDIKLFKNALFEKAKAYGFSDCEIYYNNSKSLRVAVFQKEIAQYNNSDVSGVSFRGHINGKIGYSYSEKIDLDAIDFLLKEAAEHASINDGDDEDLNPDAKVLEFKDNSKFEASPETLINYALDMEKHGYEADERIKNIPMSITNTSEMETYIANSYGMELRQEGSYAMAMLALNAMEESQVKVNYELFLDKNFDNFNPEEHAKQGVAEVVKQLGATIPNSTKSKIILKNKAASDLFMVYMQNFYAETVHKGLSLLKDKIGENVANSMITIKDVAKHEKALLELNFDSEGTIVEDKNIIENGVLKGYLYNMKSAKKDSVKSSGNGFKASFKAPVATAPANFFINPSDKSFDELLKELGTGFIIDNLSGLHAGANPISGDFSLLAGGFYVENGEIKNAVEQITIAGNFYELLKDVLAIGSDLKFAPPQAGGSIGMPSMIIDNINIAGK
ncbi:MAG: TldD/PmbA family protein [Defluviitaleaceae bacterium]|nr:TldD/PmbA family protein [Defluviitaleaceae bacterium]